MTSWWDIGWPIAALACLAIGVFCGYHWGQDARADRETAARFAAVPEPGRPRVAAPRALPVAPKAASSSTAELFARFEAEVAPATVPMQPPLGQLVAPARQHRPGPVTDAIRQWEASTDRFIAAMGGDR